MAGIFLVPLGSRFGVAIRSRSRTARPFWKGRRSTSASRTTGNACSSRLRRRGIQLRATEQPGAFREACRAERGMDCATILERVRHGVRVEDGDLATMDKASSESTEKRARRLVSPAYRRLLPLAPRPDLNTRSDGKRMRFRPEVRRSP